MNGYLEQRNLALALDAKATTGMAEDCRGAGHYEEEFWQEEEPLLNWPVYMQYREFKEKEC